MTVTARGLGRRACHREAHKPPQHLRGLVAADVQHLVGPSSLLGSKSTEAASTGGVVMMASWSIFAVGSGLRCQAGNIVDVSRLITVDG